jgi:hypothetical protein
MNSRLIPFDELVSELKKTAPGRVRIANYDALKLALTLGEDDIWDFAETYTLQAVVRDHGTLEQQQRLREEIIAGRWATEIELARTQQ